MAPWDRVENAAKGAADAYGRAMDHVLPGDSLVERGTSLLDGRSPVSPAAPFRDLAETSTEAAGQVVEEKVPALGTAGDMASDLNGAVSRVPGGYGGVLIILLVVAVWVCWRPAVKTGKTAARGAVKTYAPGAYAMAHGRPAPRKAKAPRAPKPPPGPKRTRYRCRPNKSDVMVAGADRLAVCAPSTDEAERCAARRWQGHRMIPLRAGLCQVHDRKVHVEFVKERL